LQSRSDFPDRNDAEYLKHFVVSADADGDAVIGERPVTMTKWEPQVRSY